MLFDSKKPDGYQIPIVQLYMDECLVSCFGLANPGSFCSDLVAGLNPPTIGWLISGFHLFML